MVRALYDYDGTEADDLPFKEGDLIVLVQVVDEEWMEGELNGATGYFPSSYVEMATAAPPPAPPGASPGSSTSLNLPSGRRALSDP